jgi:hypothetical protein
MKEKYAAALLAVEVFTTGCSGQEIFSDPTTTVGVTASPHVPIINLNSLPDVLPHNVAAQEPNDVKIQFLNREWNTINVAHQKVTLETVIEASGVRVGHGEFITAGHELRTSNNRPFNGVNVCGRLAVLAPFRFDSAPGTRIGIDGKKYPSYGGDLTAKTEIGSNLGDESTILPDIGYITTTEELPVLDSGVRINSSQPSLDQDVFMENFEPESDNTDRNPLESDLSAAAIAGGASKPAIYGGIVLGREPNGQVIVAEGLKSYGQHSDDVSRGGASGGPVYNAEGNLVGITVTISTGSEAQLSSDLGIGFADNYPSREIAYSTYQPVTPDLLSNLESEQPQTTHCTD